MAQLKLTHSVIVRAPALLPMLYTVSEISSLLDIPDRTLRDWLAFHDAPHMRDKKKHIWINGVQFAHWVSKIRKKKLSMKRKLAENEIYCVRCNKPVKLIKPIMKPIHGTFILIQGRCPDCGTTINRGGQLAKNLNNEE
jgi:hypothetical protein